MIIEIILGAIAVIFSLLLIRKAKTYCFTSGFIKLMDDQLLFLLLAGFPLSIISELFFILLTNLLAKNYAELEVDLKISIRILRITLIIQMLIWSQVIAKLISLF